MRKDAANRKVADSWRDLQDRDLKSCKGQSDSGQHFLSSSAEPVVAGTQTKLWLGIDLWALTERRPAFVSFTRCGLPLVPKPKA